MLKLSPAAQKSANLVYHFAQRESKSRYKRSLLGWFWSFANPLTTVAVYSFVFGVVYRASPPITENGNAENFGFFLFSGLIVWNLFIGIVNGCMGWLQGVSDLRKKVYFPTETALLGGAASNALQTTLEAVVLIVIMAVLSNLSWTVVFLFVALIFTIAFALGIGFIAAIMNARYRDIFYLVGVLLNVGFFLVPIVYPVSLVPEEKWGLPIRALVEWNPPALFVGIARDGVYFLQVPTLGHLAAASAWAGVALTIGWTYFRARSMEISEEP